MQDDAVYRLLQETALSLRPTDSDERVSLIELANGLSIDVNLLFRPKLDRHRYLATCELGRSPVVWLYRQGCSEAVVSLRPSDESALTPRERFSVAHELGHCLVYLKHDFQPVQETADRGRYWRQERAMDDFAGTLLVPPWLVVRWLDEIPCVDATCLFYIGRWGRRCAVSNKVVVRALCRALPDIGFLKVADATRVKDSARVFIVQDSCSGANICLPNQHSHLDDDRFLATFKKPAGVVSVHTCRIGEHDFARAQIAWTGTKLMTSSRRREFVSNVRLSDASYWICLMRLFWSDENKQGSLAFPVL